MKANKFSSDVSDKLVSSQPKLDFGLIEKLRALSFEALRSMFVPSEHLFVFRLQRKGAKIVHQGLSPRYTAIVLLGLADESPEAQRESLHNEGMLSVCDHVVQTVASGDNLGDAALGLWAGNRLGHTNLGPLRERLLALDPLGRPCPTVELSWALMASCVDPFLSERGFAQKVAKQLCTAFDSNSGVFPHVTEASRAGLRAHVSCFADLVYPIQALSEFHKVTGDDAALSVAVRCAEKMCQNQGLHGQWWWHYDRRTGGVVEAYPVYTVHQHGMGPMALIALEDAGGGAYDEAISKSLSWLAYSPEIEGSLIDPDVNLIWRKVARREPIKLARRLQAAATFVDPSFRVPGLNRVLPPRAVDHECRPYELGWLLYAWTNKKLTDWEQKTPL